jgi:(S)-mandelate dehydrogenase
MKPSHAVSIDHLREMARRHLPRLVFDYIEGGAEDERGLKRNLDSFAKHRLLPRYLVDVSQRDQSATLFGRSYSGAFGIAPVGLSGFARPGADLMLAKAAAAANIPFVLSGAGCASIEEVARVAPHHTWSQLYVAREQRISDDIVRRAHDTGIEVLVLTVDVPIRAKRERDIRNGFVMPPRLAMRSLLEMLSHPSWLLSMTLGGMPVFGTWAPYSGNNAGSKETVSMFASQIPFTQTWENVDALRRSWPGKLVIKGVLHPDDALHAAESGADGIIISNHGGRQIDTAPTPLEMLPIIRAAVGSRLVVMLDGGVRRGSDIIMALALGAQFVFAGRAMMYGAAAGPGGADRAIAILREEIDLMLGQIGCPSISDLGPHVLLGQ